MSTEDFAKTSWDWQLSLSRQRIGEAVEYELYRFDNVLPEISPDWKLSPWVTNLLTFLFWLVVILFVAVVILRLWREFQPYIYAWLANNGNGGNAKSKASPENVSVTTLLERSQQLYRQGNYREACRCLYLAVLQHLHDTKILPHQYSRTDAEYLQLLKLGNQTPLQPYETLITTHEQLCFGNAQMVEENYQQCRQAYREITEK
ncbi:DUF4129 domain-containing protein [Nostoc sp. CMAA1605]|uniref:DUF4129 domain-containing protein n=1 Tax=Nostoc sp. CMAA1605 TaxID=2055159 RepID=UPI001F448985|nr:DUF4129 domain-containing protein [Nostoc sp. CMAA1605]MCF4967840.1 hypothetical protein [Nostoc sp. CMAA1605]